VRVREQQFRARRRTRAVHLEGGVSIGLSAQERVLAEREAMPLRQRIREPVVREAAQRRAQPGRLSPPSATRA
jgi:hypothetical protein